MPAWLRRGVLILLVLSSLFSAVRYWELTLEQEAGGQAIAAFEERLQPAKNALPFKRGVIGYLGEWDVPGIGYEFRDQQVEYLLAQNALAPLILKKGAIAEWNVAVLSPMALAAWETAHPGKFETSSLGHNVYLLHRPGNQ